MLKKPIPPSQHELTFKAFAAHVKQALTEHEELGPRIAVEQPKTHKNPFHLTIAFEDEEAAEKAEEHVRSLLPFRRINETTTGKNGFAIKTDKLLLHIHGYLESFARR